MVIQMAASVSIIVPIYNAEKGLAKCINSILRQSYSEIEVILINDGSTDRSEEICNEFRVKDDRIKVIHQQNTGPSIARNNGILKASGKYLQFIDADDFIKSNMTERMVAAMDNNSELVICGYTNVSGYHVNEEHNTLPTRAGRFDKKGFLKHFGQLYQAIIIPSIWNKLYKKELILDHHIRFIDNVNMGEDLLFNLAYLRHCQHVYMIQEPLYYYVTHNSLSLSQAFNPNFIQNQENLYLETKQFLVDQASNSDENLARLNSIYAVSINNGLNNLFHQSSTLSSRDKKECINKILDNQFMENILPFFTGNRQLRLMKFLIKYRSVNSIYSFFKIKQFLFQKMYLLFRLAKRINHKD